MSYPKNKEPIIVGFFILQYAKLTILELYYNFCDKFCDVKKFEELEMFTDSLRKICMIVFVPKKSD